MDEQTVQLQRDIRISRPATLQRGVDWQMKVDDARCKLVSVYPKIKS